MQTASYALSHFQKTSCSYLTPLFISLQKDNDKLYKASLKSYPAKVSWAWEEWFRRQTFLLAYEDYCNAFYLLGLWSGGKYTGFQSFCIPKQNQQNFSSGRISGFKKLITSLFPSHVIMRCLSTYRISKAFIKCTITVRFRIQVNQLFISAEGFSNQNPLSISSYNEYNGLLFLPAHPTLTSS